MEMLNPLTIFHIRLPAWHISDVIGVYKAHLDLLFFQYLEQRNPVNTRRFHRHSLDPAFQQPGRQFFQFHGKGLKTSNRLRIPVGGHGNKHLCRPNVDSGGIGFNHG
jgi:hypothetical protein